MEKHDLHLELSGVSSVLHTPLAEYVALLGELGGPNVRSLTLFGAASAPDFDPSRRTARNVLVVNRVDLIFLRRLAEHGPRFGKSGLVAPLVMTPAYIASSRDTFPLELLEIQQFRRVVFGQDEFVDLVFERSAVRLQCERELKAMLIGLRQGLLASVGREKVLSALEVDAAEGLVRVLRGMAWLKGETAALPQERALAGVEQVMDRKLSGVRASLDTEARHDWGVFENLYHDVEALGEKVNAW